VALDAGGIDLVLPSAAGAWFVHPDTVVSAFSRPVAGA
jgi:hypothetical protein